MVPSILSDYLSVLTGPPLSVLTALLDCKESITVPALSSMTGYSETVVLRTLEWLKNPPVKEVKPFIGCNDTQIWISSWLLEGKKTEKLTFSVEGTPTEDAEIEKRRLHRQIDQLRRQGYDEEDIPPNEDEAHLFNTAREILTRPLTRTEAFYLGKLAGSGFGIDRITRAVEKFRDTKNPIRTTYAIMRRNGAGKPAEIKPVVKEQAYWQPPTGYTPWDES